MLFDTHAHLEDKRFADDYEQVIKRAKEAGVKYILDVGCDEEGAKKAVFLADNFPNVYAAIGLHPHDAKIGDERLWQEFYKLAEHPKVVALGEMGLDYYYDYSPREVQQEVFRRQIQMAKELNKPIIVHDREAHQDSFDIVVEEGAKEVGGVFHAYSGSIEMAKEIMKLNFYISIGGPVTFKNANKLLNVAEFIPLDRLLIETDCPYLTPHPHRGKRNEPAYVKLVAEKIAELKGITFEEVAKASLENAKRLFKIQ
ncbi:TatD DNase family protein [Desulfonispora thiosulfatigenes DSM 11270]|uniref:TatD DNase family protein n=1 Tax=Desulfonispora thiosulfatigenes DSM 11270 TaxID=656914 RepID=A0A1W1V0M8_DESTI|nr:TatD family hydrolase [Desulfonispora thiosulfatigenes]SMB86868.1 TatD DNase family protein [Desulfonispora thiosulfatigenes DSM 11270]